ncbi:MAG: hypothetical protein FWE34_08710 [Defluviitaleaceae bacterium]|nr:hypothetical protein [Defluviitaleaceae bacterium]
MKAKRIFALILVLIMSATATTAVFARGGRGWQGEGQQIGLQIGQQGSFCWQLLDPEDRFCQFDEDGNWQFDPELGFCPFFEDGTWQPCGGQGLRQGQRRGLGQGNGFAPRGGNGICWRVQ